VCFFQALNIPKLVFTGGLCPGPAGEFTTLLQTSYSAGEGDTPSPYPSLLDTFDVSILAPSALRLSDPQHKFLATLDHDRVGAHIAPHIVLFKELNKYNLGNWSLTFASISRAAVGMVIPMGIPMGMGMGWVWGL